jgi:hypothetical protein
MRYGQRAGRADPSNANSSSGKSAVKYRHRGFTLRGRMPTFWLMPTEITYGSYDGEPFVLVRGSGSIRAWLVREGSKTWERTSPAEVCHEGRVLTRARFEVTFPGLPAIPASAFTHLTESPPIVPE